MDALEIFKVAGAAAGLVSSAYFLYDRIVRIRPDAFLSGGEYPGQFSITVRNVSNESIILDEIGVSPNIIGVSKGDSSHAIIEATMRRDDNVDESARKVFIVLKPLAEMRLNLIPFEKFDQAAADQKVVVRFSWRTTRFRPLFKRNVRIRTSVTDLRGMKDTKEDLDS